MPWTEETDAASDASPPEAGRRGDAAPPTPTPKISPKAVGQRSAGPWGSAPGKRPGRAPRPEISSPPPAGHGPALPGPDLGQATRRLRIRAAELLHRPLRRRVRRFMLLGALVGFAAGWAVSGVYGVRPDEQAVVTRFGAVAAVAGPGLHIHLPWPLERAQVLAVTTINTLRLGGAADDGSQGLTPTADGQLASIALAVHWRIADPIVYLSHTADPQGALRLAAQAAMRQAVGSEPLTAVMGVDRASLQSAMSRAIQQRLDRLRAGIAVTGVVIQTVSLAPEVQAAADDVVIARQDAKASIASGEAYRAPVLAEAKATAAKALIEARSYRDQTLLEAQGAAARFDQLDAAYRKAPGVTKDRLYFETLQGVLSRAHTIVLDSPKGARVALPPDLLQAHTATPTQTAAQTQAPSRPPAPGAKP